MRVLVTGASGFVGPYLLQRLRADGHEVVATSSDGLPPPAWESDAGVVWRRLDVRDGASIEATLGDVQPEAIVHLAAVSSVARSWTDPEGTWDVNASRTHRLARWAATLCPGRRFLFVSSSEVYGASVAPDRPVAEDAPLRPLNPYGASKAAAELALEPWRVAGRLDVVIARSFGHSGPGQSPEFVLANVALQLARIRRGQQPPRLRVGNLDVRRELLDVRDVVDAYALLLERAPSGTYNVCRGVAFPLRDVVARMAALAGVEVEWERDPARFRPADAPCVVGDPARLRALGWRPRHELDDTLRALVEWARTDD